MKKLIAVVLCVVMMATMIPSFFASAAAVPAAQTEQVVAQNDDSGSDLYTALKGFIELWGGLLKLILGSEVIQGFLPGLKDVLKLVSFGDFLATLRQLWGDVTG